MSFIFEVSENSFLLFTACNVVWSTHVFAVSLASPRIFMPPPKTNRKSMNPVESQSLSMIAYRVPLDGVEAGG